MTFRRLPAEEYHRLDGHEGLGGRRAPRQADYVVAEEDGHIVGLWCQVPLIHVEPVWIAPTHRGRTVGVRLWKAVRQHLDKCGLQKVYCFAENAQTISYLTRLGFSLEPYVTYSLCMPSSPPPEVSLED